MIYNVFTCIKQPNFPKFAAFKPCLPTVDLLLGYHPTGGRCPTNYRKTDYRKKVKKPVSLHLLHNKPIRTALLIGIRE